MKDIVLNINDSLTFLKPSLCDDLIRVGDDGDGGYVVSESAIMECNLLISMGLSDNWSFESAFSDKSPGISIYTFDHTVSTFNFIKSTVKGLAKLLIGKINLSELMRRIKIVYSYRLFFSCNAIHVKSRISNRNDDLHDLTIDEIFNTFCKNKNVAIKCDIEGSEYRIIDDLYKYSDSIVMIVIEFHDTDHLRLVFDRSIKLLLEKFAIIHFHANNCTGFAKDNLPDVFELTLIHKDKVRPRLEKLELPIVGLDFKSVPGKPDYKIIFN
jgi:hypothetical protein